MWLFAPLDVSNQSIASHFEDCLMDILRGNVRVNYNLGTVWHELIALDLHSLLKARFYRACAGFGNDGSLPFVGWFRTVIFVFLVRSASGGRGADDELLEFPRRSNPERDEAWTHEAPSPSD
eukprot:3569871-Amphidinium_carterae.1